MPRPSTIDRYRLLQLLGEGGMGQVHLASAQGAAGFEKLVALKVLPDRHVGDSNRMQSLLREAMIGVRLDNEHVVQILDFGHELGRYYIAMEYVRGFSLLHVLRYLSEHDETMPVRVAVHIARTLAAALEYVHGFAERDGEPLGLIHGDVSPGNVLLAMDGRIKLADFGIAALQREVEGSSIIAGKLPYLPPEAYEGTRPSQRWDVYAAGTVLYEALAGAPAFRGEGPDEIKRAIAEGPRPLTSVRSDCPAPLLELIDRALAPPPDGRFAGATELREALEQAYPRRVDDIDVHREFVERIYRADEFVGEHGELPTTGGFRSTLNLKPLVEASMDTETAVGVPARPKVLKLGFSPALGPDLARAAGERLSRYLSEKLECTVRTVVLADYHALVESTASGEVDLSWMPPFAFAHAEEMAVGALVTAQRRGRPTYESALIVRDDSNLQSLEDLRGRSVAWVDRASASGFLFAAAELIRALGRLDDALARQHYFGSHRDVCEAVASGWADAGATYVSRDEAGTVQTSGWLDTLGPRARDVRPLHFSAPIPGDNIAYRPYLPEPTRDEVKAAFLAMPDDPDGTAILSEIFHADGWVPTELSIYESVRSRLRLL